MRTCTRNVNDDIELDYDYMMQRALRGMMRDVLSLVAEIGDAPGEHHFYIEFLTGGDGVEMPDHLRDDYPERMTIVLQHQFEGLKVDEDRFAVTLWFKGREAALSIPFEAVTSFADPSVQFGLRFERAEPDAADAPPAPSEDRAPGERDASKPAAPETDKKSGGDEKEKPAKTDKSAGADVVSLDAFRKK